MLIVGHLYQVFLLLVLKLAQHIVRFVDPIAFVVKQLDLVLLLVLTLRVVTELLFLNHDRRLLFVEPLEHILVHRRVHDLRRLCRLV